MAIFARNDGEGNVTIYGASAVSDGQGHVTLLEDEYEVGDVIAEDEVSLSLVDVSGDIAEAEDAAKSYADEVDARVSEAFSQITQLADSIASLVVGEDGASMMEQTENGWKFSMASVLDGIKANEDANAALDGKIDDKVKALQDQLDALGAYVTISTSEDGTPYIELGNSGYFKVRITNEKMTFLHVKDGVTTELTTIDTEKMNIATANITEELRVGKVVMEKHGAGNVGFVWREA